MKSIYTLTASVVLLCGCTSTRPAEIESPGELLRHESLHSTLWQQTATEYAGITMGAYSLAALRMDEGLSDTLWTASLEQLGAGNYSGLPPAVVLDVDETVLDNSAFQARLIQDDDLYGREIWNAWILEEQAGAVPGALDFTRYAASKGVHIIYLTNREGGVEQSTINNLKTLGFPFNSGEYSVISKAERPEWSSSDKTPRRSFVGERYRILLLIGDNYGDFSEDASGSLSDRKISSENYASYWGKKWIVLPNPMYGTWERALFNYNYSLTFEEQLETKKSHLNSLR